MFIYSEPPKARTFREDNATLLVCWWCTIFAMFIIIFRVCGRFIRSEKLFREDWIAFACIIPLISRMVLVHCVLYFGTNNAYVPNITNLEIHSRSMGSKIVLISRILYAATLWTLKLTISEFFKRLTWNISTSSHEVTLKGIRWFLLFTFLVVVIADLSECQKFSNFWQVVPDPGPHCRQGFAQLLTMGTMNIITDFLLAFFPIPIILKSHMGLVKKIQLILLFSLSLLPAGITIFRIPHVIDRHGSQQYRSVLASVEILMATIAANAVVLGSFVRDRGVKKQKFKLTSTNESEEPVGSVRGKLSRFWGSDEDLVRDLGLCVDPEILQTAVVDMPDDRIYRVNWPLPTQEVRVSKELKSFRFEPQSEINFNPVFMPPRNETLVDIEKLQRSSRVREICPKTVVLDDRDSSSCHFPPASYNPKQGLSFLTL
ncbi:putative protein/integral membrane protein [Golovinomyces cichoracearum]|uniref:Rhodopsin domain-containing protein n=1 Tax=Golovinomyces cichoracearum TaxID=62708 RepID=A0A420I756_9PEZI|nr:putative protein/integral membrane protein [Golovinomyces cichoracearum]